MLIHDNVVDILLHAVKVTRLAPGASVTRLQLSVCDRCIHAAAGCASGALVTALGFFSLGEFKKGRLCKPATAASLLIAVALTAVMWKRYQDTGAIFPALVISVTSAGMALFYVWSLVAGPKPNVKKSKA